MTSMWGHRGWPDSDIFSGHILGKDGSPETSGQHLQTLSLWEHFLYLEKWLTAVLLTTSQIQRVTDYSPGLCGPLWHPTPLWVGNQKGLKHRNKFELEVNIFWRDLSSTLDILSTSPVLSWFWFLACLCRNLAQVNMSLSPPGNIIVLASSIISISNLANIVQVQNCNTPAHK